ncbi:hypothetical protein BO86DRAFT_210688 [Aspergillus japonicus CBS 114.51]|uniref:Secreted protein n=1 Tax=Aspergillus japonicus CBS 114.51 TaxID=1448312 RepID=A0A8T8X9U1_ASPJA|nr:hypothetical protein BO86DRAFT_210688 [Aspergillus japonicus CBS 114.51]RAH84973.1 hypothetical protein BO86DRAFT_210688 [Aspergillus japonicus CBS 114.51]
MPSNHLGLLLAYSLSLFICSFVVPPDKEDEPDGAESCDDFVVCQAGSLARKMRGTVRNLSRFGSCQEETTVIEEV